MPVNIGGAVLIQLTNNVTLEDCTDIVVINKTNSIEIKWKDPEDTVFNNQITAHWIGTKLVRKEDGYPKNDKDGILVLDNKVRNQYSMDGFSDTSVDADVTYYYCLFPYTEKLVTMSDDNRFTGKRLSFEPVLKDNSWDQIAAASEQGIASSLWQIGDEITVSINGSVNIFQIWDFNHYNKTDGSGKAGILFGMKDLLYLTGYHVQSNDVGWANWTLRKNGMTKLLNTMDSGLVQHIKDVIVEYDHYPSRTDSTTDKLFIPSLIELGHYSDDGYSIPIFTDNTSRIKRFNSSPRDWSTRTQDRSNSGYFKLITSKGDALMTSSGLGDYYCIMFNI